MTARPQRYRRAPRHEPIVRTIRRERATGMLVAGLVSIALWSIIGAIVALRVDLPDAAWDFLWSLIGSAVTLIALGIYQGRCNG